MKNVWTRLSKIPVRECCYPRVLILQSEQVLGAGLLVALAALHLQLLVRPLPQLVSLVANLVDILHISAQN